MSSNEPQTKPCRYCKRKFVPESLTKHQMYCQNMMKPRKVFDSSKQRANEDLSLRQIKAAQKKVVAKPKSNWKRQHEEFINTIRSAKDVTVAMQKGEPLPPPPPPSLNPDYVQCPYCSRRFNEKAAERHIKFCAEQQKRVGNKREPKADEKARAQARTTYHPPKPKGRGAETSSPGMIGGRSAAAPGGGYSAGSAGGRGAPSTRAPPASTKQAAGRAPAVNNGYGSNASRAPAGSRGRPAPGNERTTYQPNDFNDFNEYIGTGQTNSEGFIKCRQVHQYEDMKSVPKVPSATSRPKVPPMRGGMAVNRPWSGVHSKTVQQPDYHNNSSEEIVIDVRNGKPPPKFCYECGAKFPSLTAKFCSECGLRRLNVS